MFYASAEQPSVPVALRSTVGDLGRILGYTPHREARPPTVAPDVPGRGLTPNALMKAYDADSLAAAGHTGKGQTIVFYEFDGYDQTDLDDFTKLSGLPPLTPILIDGQPGEAHGEAEMDLDVAMPSHPTRGWSSSTRVPPSRAAGLTNASPRCSTPWTVSFPVRYGVCDRLGLRRNADRQRSAARAVRAGTAQSHGTSAFDAGGDNGGLECKGGHNFSAPPGPDDIGLDAVASLPAMTSVGGTTTSTGVDGQWLAEQAAR